MIEETMKCPICNSEMWFMHGAHWDYDRWYCTKRVGLKLCPGEIELETTTCPDGMEP